MYNSVLNHFNLFTSCPYFFLLCHKQIHRLTRWTSSFNDGLPAKRECVAVLIRPPHRRPRLLDLDYDWHGQVTCSTYLIIQGYSVAYRLLSHNHASLLGKHVFGRWQQKTSSIKLCNALSNVFCLCMSMYLAYYQFILISICCENSYFSFRT